VTPGAYVYTWGARRHADKFAGLEGRRSPNPQADLLLGIGLVFTLAAAGLRPVASR
jgi:hypothetical protein